MKSCSRYQQCGKILGSRYYNQCNKAAIDSQYSCKLFPGTRYSSWWDLWSGRIKWSEARLAIFLCTYKTHETPLQNYKPVLLRKRHKLVLKKGNKRKTLPTIHQKEEEKGVTLSSRPGDKQRGGCGRTLGFGLGLLQNLPERSRSLDLRLSRSLRRSLERERRSRERERERCLAGDGNHQ